MKNRFLLNKCFSITGILGIKSENPENTLGIFWDDSDPEMVNKSDFHFLIMLKSTKCLICPNLISVTLYCIGSTQNLNCFKCNKIIYIMILRNLTKEKAK